MSLTIGQGVAVSYNAVLNEKRGKAANQWAESAFMRLMEKQGMIKREGLGPLIEVTLDYQRNPGTVIHTTDLQPLSLSKTEVLTAAQYSIAEVSVPITWSKKDEVANPTENQKINLVTSLISNAIDSHDDQLEQALFTASTNGFLGLPTFMPTSGQGSPGGVDAATNVFWRNPSNTYVDDTDIEAGMTVTYNAVAKGSGAKLIPTWVVSDGNTQALFAGTQQALQRFGDANMATAGFKTLKFITADYVFSQYGTTSLFFGNNKSLQLKVSKQYFRARGETQPLQGQEGFYCSVYSACQTVTDNKSRLGVLHL